MSSWWSGLIRRRSAVVDRSRSSAVTSSHQPEVAVSWRTWLLPAVLCGTLVLVASHPRVGVTVDSAEYLSVAESVAAGEGLVMSYHGRDEPYPPEDQLGEPVPLTQFPPLYPVVVGALSRVTGLPVEDAARLVGALCFAGLAGLFSALVRRYTDLLSMWVAVLLLATRDVIATFATAWSEQLFLPAFVAEIALLCSYERRPSRAKVVAMAVAAAVASGARFIGVAVGLGAAIALWLGSGASDQKVQRRLHAAVVAAAGLLPPLLWALRNRAVLGEFSEKTLGFHPARMDDLADAFLTIARWFPGGPVTSIPLAAFAGWAFYRSWRRQGSEWVLVRAALVMAATVMAVIIVAHAFMDANIPFSERLLLPLELAVIIGIAIGVRDIAGDPRLSSRLSLRWAAALVAGLMAASSVAFSITFAGSERSGYVAERWFDSRLLEELRALEPDTVVVTNTPEAVQLHTGLDTLLIPLEHDHYADRPNTSFEEQLGDLDSYTNALMRQGHPVVLAFFYRPNRGGSRPLPSSVLDGLNLQPVSKTAEGELLQLEQS